MPLEEYRRKRDFAKTPGAGRRDRRRPAATGRFVVQRHRATRLHYDFRLEIDGVLVSWAVPKGPTLDSGDPPDGRPRRGPPDRVLRLRGRDPASQYGAGDVIVWDWGTWEPEARDARPARGRRGRRAEVRAPRREGQGPVHDRPDEPPAGQRADDRASRTTGEQWLLIKKRDATPSTGWDAEDHPQSVKTGRTNDEVKAEPRRASGSARQPAADRRDRPRRRGRATPMPDCIEPMLATLATKAVQRPRLAVRDQVGRLPGRRRSSTTARSGLWTRNLKDAETYFPRLLSPADAGSTRSRRSSTARSSRSTRTAGPTSPAPGADQRASRGSAGGAERGRSSTRLRPALPRRPLAARRPARGSQAAAPERAARARRGSASPRTSRARARRSTAAARERGLEGIVAKLRRSRYEPGRRTPAWLKIKIRPSRSSSSAAGRRARATPATSARSPSASTRTASCGSPARSGRGSPAATRKRAARRDSSRSRPTTPPFDPPPPQRLPRPLGRRPRRRHLGQARSS